VEGDGHTNSDIPSSTPDKIALREELSQSNRGTDARGSHSSSCCAPSHAACLAIDYLMVLFQKQKLHKIKIKCEDDHEQGQKAAITSYFKAPH
jgi:hypothetical protein